MKTTNLSLEEKTLLIMEYRLLKFLEKASHRSHEKVSLQENLTENELKERFCYLFLESVKNNSPNTEEYYQSREIVEQGILFNLLREKGLLAEAIVDIEKAQSKRGIGVGEAEEYIDFLNYCIKNPQELNKYKGGIR